jgi:DNA-directed RNA polymerase specialized sigma24 family protein
LLDRIADIQPIHYQRILLMRGAGATFAEIAAELDLDERTVRRILDDFRQRFKA